jgi:hypothetical protein
MSVITSRDRQQRRSQDGKSAIRALAHDRAPTVEMDDPRWRERGAGTYLDEKTARMIRRRGRYISTKDTSR